MNTIPTTIPAAAAFEACDYPGKSVGEPIPLFRTHSLFRDFR
jgi:hypothetical protein